MQAILNRPSRVLQIAVVLFSVLAFASAARADIFQWEYINPADPSQGKQQSTTLAPGGAGVNAVPGAYLALRDLTMAYLIGADLTNITGSGANLTEADLTRANLTNAVFPFATLAGCNLTSSEVRGAEFGYTGITPAQLYSTASYQAHDLTGISLSGNNLSGWNFAGQALASASFAQSSLAGADFSKANLANTNCYFAALNGANLSQATLTHANLKQADLTDATLIHANLTDALLEGAGLTGADFAGAEIRGVDFSIYFDEYYQRFGTGITPTQLYSTASYQAKDLSGAIFGYNDLTGGNFAGQNLTGANFDFATLTGADLGHANLSNASFYSATLMGANLTNAEVRGASFNGTGLTLAQLYSTASYRAKDLSGIGLGGNLAGGNFAGQNLTGANLYSAVLTGADFRAANLTDVTFGSTTLNGASADLTSADFTGAEIRGAGFGVPTLYDQVYNVYYTVGTGITLAQLYSTASYQAHDLSGIDLSQNSLAGANFTNQKVTRASFTGATLTGADFTGAEIRGASFDIFLIPGFLSIIPSYQSGTGLTLNQLYSTASYQAHDLSGISLSFNNLTGSNFAGQNLSNANFAIAALTGADFRFANLTNANFQSAVLLNADFSQANLTAANFTAHQGFADYLIPTFYGANLTGGNFRQANLTNANFAGATLTDADFSGAEIRGASFSKQLNYDMWDAPSRTFLTGSGITPAQLYSTVSYQAHDLSGIGLGFNHLAGVTFAGQNLANASFYGAELTGADFTGTEIRGASFEIAEIYEYSTSTYRQSGTGITLAQLYSTASYQAKDLSGVSLGVNNLAGGNFAGQNLTNVQFYLATLTGADFTSADARGAQYLGDFDYWGATTTNLILPNGHVNGLDLDAGRLLIVRDYDGDSRYEPAQPPIPITVDQHLAMGPGGTLRMVFEADAWNSTISFAPGTPVTLGGTLELTFAPEVNLAGEIGRTIDVFHWTGVSPIGAFMVSSSYTWDLSKLYTTGDVTLLDVPGLFKVGDFDRDGQLTAADIQAMLSALTDLNAYETAHGLSDAALILLGDLNGDHAVTNADLQPLINLIANETSQAVPEPATVVLAACGFVGLAAAARRRPSFGTAPDCTTIRRCSVRTLRVCGPTSTSGNTSVRTRSRVWANTILLFRLTRDLHKRAA
jgi:uncharacterized protein YjbI with pentapeptide repeats